MSKRRLWLYAGGLVAALAILWRSRSSRFQLPSFLTGRKVTHTTPSDDGWIFVRPSQLAQTAGLDLATYTLARAIGSEASQGGSTLEKVAIGWAFANRARATGRSFLVLATNTSRYGDQGYYGSQEHGRYISTARDPSDIDVYIARQIINRAWADPTGGSDQFLHTRVQSVLHQRKPELYQSPQQVIASRIEDGKEPVTVPGLDPDFLLFFRKA